MHGFKVNKGSFLLFLLIFYQHILIIHNEFIVTYLCMDIMYFYYILIPFILSCPPLREPC